MKAVPSRSSTRLAGAALLALLALGACARHYVAQRLPAPAGGAEAVLSAAVMAGDLSYDVQIVAPGAEPGPASTAVHLEGILHKAGSAGVVLQWLQGDLLLVRFEDARAYTQPALAIDVGGRRVRVELQKGALD